MRDCRPAWEDGDERVRRTAVVVGSIAELR
jgi:hypothetical protein